ncbi:MAG: YciI family protein [Acidobacteriia bacterium]|nr:YciI family protein [Terriglobia bacterium]
MSEFTFLFRGRDTNASPEQMQKTMEKWVAWFKDLGAKGHLKEPGHPLELTGKVVKGSQKTIIDGPYAEAKDVVGGFTVVEARDLAHAAELAKACPILEAGGSVEVRPIQKMNM